MTIAIHQPNYLPWLHYFYKIWASDVFVLHDNVEYSKNSFTKRVFIRNAPAAKERVYLSVPLERHSDFTLIRDLKINNEQNWQTKHLNKIKYVYGRAPFFKIHFPRIEHILAESRRIERLATLNQELIEGISAELDIKTPFLLSSELPITGFRADEYNAAIVAHLGGTHYLSGAGGVKYQQETTYSTQNITLKYSHSASFTRQAPPQYPVVFDNGLSVLDALFYIGGAAITAHFEHTYSKTHIL
jgi:hypothetical protein